MRTSASQFELLITYMEQHGDISKPSSDANGKIKCMRNWEQLTLLLNSDGSGDTKTTEKWRKVWSDIKNNTKRKAARLHRAANATGGGPADFKKLTDLENRILNLIGVKTATGLAVVEAGLPQRISIEHRVLSPRQLDTDEITPFSQPSPTSGFEFPSMPSVVEEVEVETTFMETEPNPQPPIIVTPPQPFTSLEVQDPQPACSGNIQTSHVEFTETRPTQVALSESGQITPRRGRRTRGTPRRRLRPTSTEQAAQHFLQADEEWRRFKMAQHNDHMQLRREQNRIRADEIQVQKNWQGLCEKALGLLEKIVDKYCNK